MQIGQIVQELWYLVGFLFVFTLCAGAGIAGALVSVWTLRSRILGLESSVETIHASLTSEIKRRAAFAKPKKDELDELAEKLKAEPPKVEEPWWVKFNKTGAQQG